MSARIRRAAPRVAWSPSNKNPYNRYSIPGQVTPLSHGLGMEHKDIRIYGSTGKELRLMGTGQFPHARTGGNSELYNGRLEHDEGMGTCRANNTTFSSKSWETYMDVEVESKCQLSEDYRFLRYSCMTRNRDNNSNRLSIKTKYDGTSLLSNNSSVSGSAPMSFHRTGDYTIAAANTDG